MKRWPTIVLIVSIVLNVFLIGAIAGGFWRWNHEHRGGMGMHNGWRMRAADALPGPQNDAFRQAVRGTVKDAMPIVNAGRAARAEAGRLFVQPTLDVAATTAAFDRARTADMIVRARVEHKLVQFAATLPLEQRQKLGEALKAGPLRERRGHRPTD